MLAELLATTLGVERVSVVAHLFDDLGANSLLLARFAAQVRGGWYIAGARWLVHQEIGVIDERDIAAGGE